MRVTRMTLCGVVLCGSISGGALAQSPFDPPLETRREKQAPDPQNPGTERTVSCFDYPNFTIKQVDLGEVGASSLSIAPPVSGEKPACNEAQKPGEYEIPGESWTGYFSGAKGDYAFFDAGDGTNGGLGFMAFQVSTKKKLFDDVADGGLQSVIVKGGELVLRYRRQFAGSCSAVTDGPSCGERLAKEIGVATVPSSMCAEGYKSAKQAMAKMRCEAPAANESGCIEKELKTLDEQKWDASPTVLAYDVETTLGDAAPSVKPLGEAVACFPSN